MKKIYSLFMILLSLTTTFGCSAPADTNGGTSMNPTTMKENMLPIGPVKEFTLEDRINTANDLLSAACESYQIMTELSDSDSAPAKGVKAANKVKEQYDTRLEELKTADFSTWSAEDLSALALELSDIITAIREARDLLNA